MLKKNVGSLLCAVWLLLVPFVLHAITQEEYKTALVAYQKALKKKDFTAAQEQFDVLRAAYEQDVQSSAGRTILVQVNFDLQPLVFDYDGLTKKFKQFKAPKDDPNDFISYNAEFLTTKKCVAPAAAAAGMRAPLAVETPAPLVKAGPSIKETELQLQLEQIKKELAAANQERDKAVAQRDAAVKENKELKVEINTQVQRLNEINGVLQDAMSL